jgi:PAS domain S-box-containing protein
VFRVLHLGDDPRDRELVAAALQGEAASRIVDVSAAQFEFTLADGPFSLIILGHGDPAVDENAVRAIAGRVAPDVPIAVLSGQGAARAASATRAIEEARRVRSSRGVASDAEPAGADLEARVRERTSQLTAILENTPSLITMKDLDGRYLYVNAPFERTLGLIRDRVLGKSDRELFPPRLADMYRASDKQALARSATITVEEPVIHRDGTVHVYSVAKFPVFDTDRQPYAVCTVATNITERKRAEDEIKTARLEAERANSAKSDFLSRMSHDLRTPLNSVMGFAQLLSMEPLTEGQMECVRLILRGGEHLVELINEVLDIARIEAGQLSLSPEPVEVHEIVAHSVSLVAPLAAQRQIEVSVADSPLLRSFVLADRQRLSQILLNLLSNAVKYNRHGGRVTLSAEAAGDRLRINVTDTGAGIPPQNLRLLFRPFERLGAEQTAIEGTGLGLTLSRGLAQAMGGSIGVVSRIDVGSTFWVELQSTGAAAPHAEPSHAEGDDGDAGSVATVLYIEDNKANVRLMERALMRRPWLRLIFAGDGRSGLTCAIKEQPDIILLDLHLPDLPGEGVLRELRADPVVRDTPVIVLSADATQTQIRRLLSAGASAYLTKPLNLNKVMATMDRLLAEKAPRAPLVPDGDNRE